MPKKLLTPAMDLEAALTEYRYSRDLTPSSHDWYHQKLGAFVQWCALPEPEGPGITTVEDITPSSVRRFLALVRERPSIGRGHADRPVSSQTLHGYARAIRAFLHWSVAEGLLDANVPARIQMPKREQRVKQALTAAQVDALLRACDASELPAYVARDKAIVAVLIDTGIRASELCGLRLGDIVFDPDEPYLTVMGKGRKQRSVGLGRASRQLLHRYLFRYRRVLLQSAGVQRGAPQEQEEPERQQHVFLGKRGPLTPAGLDRLWHRLAERAGAQGDLLEGVHVHPHLARHTFATLQLEQGADIYRVSRLMGHSSLSVTEGYVKSYHERAARRGARSVLDTLEVLKAR